uniref:Uncharacterized protein n=1 Tax=Fagus sylvatica TaxID=28930 RepID=A0A2N9G0R4_FAGSY
MFPNPVDTLGAAYISHPFIEGLRGCESNVWYGQTPAET